MASGRRSGRQNILRSLLDEEDPREKANEKINTVSSPPRTRNQTAQSQETTVTNKKLSPPNTGNQSPDPNCSICLGKLENKSFTDSCFHMFCFACLLEWSKVKAECPLCKQPFKSIIHNVRSYEDYDQYNIQEAQERAAYPWETPEGFRFRYRTTVTFDRLMEAHYEEQQRQLRLLQRPTLMQTRSQWRRRRQGATSEFRHRIYLNSMRVTSVTSRKRRERKIGPSFYRSNPACSHRLVPWLNRELNALSLLHNPSEHVHTLMDLIMDLIKSFDIESDETFDHLHRYLGRNTRHFLHEFASFARSPYDMDAYDRHAVYEPYTETVSDEEESFSSPGSDIIIVDDIITTTELPETRAPRKKRNKFPLDPNIHNPEHPSVIQGGPFSSAISTTSTSGWDSPTPGPSGLFASPLHSETVFTSLATVDTSPSQNVAVKKEERHTAEVKKQTASGLPATSDTDLDSDDSVVILKVEKPWYERTPITISSGPDEEIVIKNEESDSRKNHQSKRKHQEQNSSRSRNSSSDTIDVTSVTSEPKHKKHKHKHERGHKKGKRKHKKASRHSHIDDTKSSEHSKNSEKQDSRKAAEERRKTRHSKSSHSLHFESRSHSDFPSVSSAYGGDDSVKGKYGEFFEWLHQNADSSYHYPGSRERRNWIDSRSRSRSYESLWPSSSRSRSPTLSISPIKKSHKRDKRSRQDRSRSSSIECIAVVDGSYVDESYVDKKRIKKHKKHKKHKHKKSKTHIETIKSNSDIEVMDVGDDVDVLDLVTSGDNSGSKPSNAEERPMPNQVNGTEPAAGSSSQKSSEAPDSGKKYKKHPTGHKTSSFKPVKIKRNTELLKPLQNLMLPSTSSSDSVKITEICVNVPKPSNDHIYNSTLNILDVSTSGQSVSALDLSTSDSSKNDLSGSYSEDLRNSTILEKPQSDDVLDDIDVVTCDDKLNCYNSGHDSEETLVDYEPEIDVENSDFETHIFSDQEIDVVTCDNESKVDHSSEMDSVDVKSSSEDSLSDIELDVVSVEPTQDAKEFCKSVPVNLDSSPGKQQMCVIDQDDDQKLISKATEVSIASSERHGICNGLDMLQTEPVESANNVNSIYFKDLQPSVVDGFCQSVKLIKSRIDVQEKLTDNSEIVSKDVESGNCDKTKILPDSNIEPTFSDVSNDNLQHEQSLQMTADKDQQNVTCSSLGDLPFSEEQIFANKPIDQLEQSVSGLCQYDVSKRDLKDEQIFADYLDGEHSVDLVGDDNVQSTCASYRSDSAKSTVQQSVNLASDFDNLSTNDEKTCVSKCVNEIGDACISAVCNSAGSQEGCKGSETAKNDTTSLPSLSDGIGESNIQPGIEESCTAPRLSKDAVDSLKLLTCRDLNISDAISPASPQHDIPQQIRNDANIGPSIKTIETGCVLGRVAQNNSESAISSDVGTQNFTDYSKKNFDALTNYSHEDIGESQYSQTVDNVISEKGEGISTPDKCHTPPEHNVLVH